MGSVSTSCFSDCFNPQCGQKMHIQSENTRKRQKTSPCKHQMTMKRCKTTRGRIKLTTNGDQWIFSHKKRSGINPTSENLKKTNKFYQSHFTVSNRLRYQMWINPPQKLIPNRWTMNTYFRCNNVNIKWEVFIAVSVHWNFHEGNLNLPSVVSRTAAAA